MNVGERSGAAIVMRRYGGPCVLGLEQVPLAPLGLGEIRLRTLAAAVNHSDLEIRAGAWPILRDDPFPYVPGLECVGEVVEVTPEAASFRVGDRAITMMQGLGGVRAERPGAYAEYVTVAAEAAAPVAAEFDPCAVAALGLAAVTALEGLRKLGALEGRRIAITGASGGVGSAALGLAKALGAQTVAIVSRTERIDHARGLGAAEVVLAGDAAEGALGEEALDGALDVVGGLLFGPLVAALRTGATLSVLGAVGGGAVSLDPYRLQDVTLTGYSSERLDGASLRRAMARIQDWLRDGVLKPPPHTMFALGEAAAAHDALERHAMSGRLLLIPGS